MRHSNARWNDGLPRAAGSRWIPRRYRRPSDVSEGHMSDASSARECAIAASPGSTSQESSSDERAEIRQRAVQLTRRRDDERTERREPDRKGDEDIGELQSRRFGYHQTCESVLLNTRRCRHHHRRHAVDAVGPRDGAASVSPCRARRCLIRRSPARRSWMRLLARQPCCHAAGGEWT